MKVIKFSKDGCVPCQTLANRLTEVDFTGHELVEINISKQPEYIEKYGLSSVPVLVFEKDGDILLRLIGLQPVEAIEDALAL